MEKDSPTVRQPLSGYGSVDVWQCFVVVLHHVDRKDRGCHRATGQRRHSSSARSAGGDNVGGAQF